MVEIKKQGITRINTHFPKSRLKRGIGNISRDLIVSFLQKQGIVDKHGVLLVDPSRVNEEKLYLALGEVRDQLGIMIASMFLSKKEDIDKNSEEAIKAMQDFAKAQDGHLSPKFLEAFNSLKALARSETKKVQEKYIPFMENKDTMKNKDVMEAANELILMMFGSLSNICSLIITMRLEG